MERIGLVAGEGNITVEFARSVRKTGDKVIVFALQGAAPKELETEADRVYWLKINQYKKLAFLLLKDRIRNLVLLGKFDKKVIYDDVPKGEEVENAFKGLKDQKDYSILEEITRHLKRLGVSVVEGTKYLSHLLPEKGVLSSNLPDEGIKEDINFGFDIAKKLAGMDIGQTIVEKGKSVVAVEAMEGTDRTIERAGEVAGAGCVMIKVSRPRQDMRWDVPVVGPTTIEKLAKSGFKALALESGKMFLVEKDKVKSLADSSNMIVQVL